MEHKKVSRYLIAAGILAALVGGVVFFVFVPFEAVLCRALYPEWAHLFWPGLALTWIIAGLYMFAMADYFRICGRIGKDQSFCMENARGLHRIAWLLIAAGGVILATALACFLGNVGNFGFTLMLLAVAVASAAMGVLAWGLGKLLARAVRLKEENDLTV
ncbi:MAG: DUF2975 domain-containing protein [Clostridia bacterium]|nr:DUF2975 domain-containing protein [Clostridia bacterium]